MTTRPTRALLGAVTLAAAVITAGHPAGATGKAPPCPATPTIIVSGAETITGTECADWIFPGKDTRLVLALGGDDHVKVAGPGCGCDEPYFRVELGDGDDQLVVQRAVWLDGYGDEGDDDLRADWMVVGGYLHGWKGDDRLWTSSPHPQLRGWDGNDRLEVSAVSTAGQTFSTSRQVVWGGLGDDVVSTMGARGPRTRLIAEDEGDDTYLLRHAPGDGGVDLVGYKVFEDEPMSGQDTAIVDPNDALMPGMFGQIETFQVGWAP
jgi:hypothetical protein